VALLEPSRVKGLIVLDIAPVQYTSKEPHWLAVEDIIRTLRNVQMSSSRNDVEQQLRPSIPDPNLRAFCLTNVDWSTGQWKIPLDHIHRQLDQLASFDLTTPTSTSTQQQQQQQQPQPELVLPDNNSSNHKKLQFTGDAFFINGGQSKFVRSSHLSAIQEYFPNHMLTTIKGAGHWVHAEAPEDTTALIQQFLNR
jgi:pimeloyl-ACP methyl ester carboxylesterase